MHLLFGFPVSIPLEHLEIAQLCSHNKVVKLGVQHHGSDVVLFARHSAQHSRVVCVYLRAHTRMKLVQVDRSCVPGAKLSSLQIKGQPFEPFATAPKFVIVTPNLFEVLNGNLHRIAFGVKQNCLSWRVRILNVQLVEEDAFATGSDKLV